MKARRIFSSGRNVSSMEKTKCQKEPKRNLRALVMLRRFFDTGEGYKVGAAALAPRRRSIQHSTRVPTQACLPTAQIPIPPIKKDECRETGMTTENTAQKAVADCTAGSGTIAAARCANRTRVRIGTSTQTRSYLALNWQRGQVNAGFTSRDRRFHTPQPTTSHVFWPNEQRRVSSSLPNSQPNSPFLARKCTEGGRGSARRKSLKAPYR
jgi:hypothetical protein